MTISELTPSHSAIVDITLATDAVVLCHRYFISSTCLAQTTLTQPIRKMSTSFRSDFCRGHKMRRPDSTHRPANIGIQWHANHLNGKQRSRVASCILIALQSSEQTYLICSAIQGYHLIFGHSLGFLDILQYIKIKQVIICIDRVKPHNTRILVKCNCQLEVFTDPNC
jgi:hypothetical protein